MNDSMTHTVFSSTYEELVTNANRTKNILNCYMLNEGIITQEQFDEMEKYVIVLAKKNMFNRIYDYLFDNKENETNGLAIVVHKTISRL